MPDEFTQWIEALRQAGNVIDDRRQKIADQTIGVSSALISQIAALRVGEAPRTEGFLK